MDRSGGVAPLRQHGVVDNLCPVAGLLRGFKRRLYVHVATGFTKARYDKTYLTTVWIPLCIMVECSVGRGPSTKNRKGLNRSHSWMPVSTDRSARSL